MLFGKLFVLGKILHGLMSMILDMLGVEGYV